MKILLQENFLTIYLDDVNNWLYAEWKGYQTVESIKIGCEKILDFIDKLKLKKVLNDNTSVSGIWSGASNWVSSDWFPRIIQAGLTHFAWIYSTSVLSKLSTDETLKGLDHKSFLKTFNDIEKAKKWLKAN